MAKDYNKLFDEVIDDISNKGVSLITAIKGKMSPTKFYELLKDKDRDETYTRAREARADIIADEIIQIADNCKGEDNVAVQRDRLKVDTRKWLLSKLMPKRYGDRIEVEQTGEIHLHFDADDEKL